MDASGSIIRSDYELAKQFMSDVILAMDVENRYARVALIVFSTTTTVVFRLGEYEDRRLMLDAIGKYKISPN